MRPFRPGFLLTMLGGTVETDRAMTHAEAPPPATMAAVAERASHRMAHEALGALSPGTATRTITEHVMARQDLTPAQIRHLAALIDRHADTVERQAEGRA